MTIRKRNFHIALDEYSEKAVERLKKIEKYDALIKEKYLKLLSVRPHQSLGLLTPCQYLERLKIEVRGSYV